MVKWQKLADQTRWRIAVRVLPVVFLSIVLLGAFSWSLFSRQVTQQFVEQQEERVSVRLDRLTQRAALAAMSLEASKNTLQEDDAFVNRPTALVDELLHHELAAGVLLFDPQEQGRRRLRATALNECLQGAQNNRQLIAWLNRTRMPSDISPTHMICAAAHAAGAHTGPHVILYEPLLLGSRSTDADAADSACLALLPVLVRRVGGTDKDHGAEAHSIYLLDLAALARNEPDEGLWCLLDDAGRVLTGNGDCPPVGSILAEHPQGGSSGLLYHFSGADLVGAPKRRDLTGHVQGGPRLAPWIVVSSTGHDIPVTLVLAGETRGLRNISLLFVIGVMLVGLVAVVAPLFGLSRVVRGLAERLVQLAGNLEAVARGDYSQRLSPGRQDEVGRLISYFNLMSVSLDEAHRQLKGNETRLQAALDNMRAVDLAKDDFIVLVSHEVRTPLTSIMAGVDLLKSSVRKAEPNEREMMVKLNLPEVLAIIESSGERLHGFMNDAIQMSSVQSGEKELDLTAVPVGHLLEVGLCGIRERARDRGIAVDNELAEIDDWAVLCDQSVLKLALEKLLNNAVAHNRPTGRILIREADGVPGLTAEELAPTPEMVHRLTAQPSFRPFEDDEISWRLVEIFNTGRPIPSDRRRALFRKFELVGRIEHHQRGSGLSLPIAQLAINHHGGRILLACDEQDGNSFYLLLPTLPVTPDRRRASRLGQKMPESFGRVAGHKDVCQI